VAARARSACGRQPASRRRLFGSTCRLLPLAPLYERLTAAAGASCEAGKKDDRRGYGARPAYEAVATKGARRVRVVSKYPVDNAPRPRAVWRVQHVAKLRFLHRMCRAVALHQLRALRVPALPSRTLQTTRAISSHGATQRLIHREGFCFARTRAARSVLLARPGEHSAQVASG
jgi:hypothetical protein